MSAAPASAPAVLHRCGPDCAPWTRPARGGRSRSRWQTVDVHCHMFTSLAEELVARTPQKKAEAQVQRKLLGEPSVTHNDAVMFPRAIRKMSSIEERLRDMDETGVDVQVVSPSPTQYYYWADRDLASALVRAQNEHIAEQCARHPARLAGMATVSLQHPDLAVAQLRHAVRELGLAGVEISTVIDGRDLDDARFHPFWALAEELQTVVFVHPLGTTLGERVNGHYLSNIIGQPLETTVALSKLILGGLFDRHPGLKLLAAHGGGYLPGYAGRLDHGYRVRPETRTTARPPSEYLKQIWFDSVVYDPPILQRLIDVAGLSQVVLGTDYPFDMGMDDVHAFLRDVPSIDDAGMRDILGANASRLFNLPRPSSDRVAPQEPEKC